jgi:hypothetical protein
MKIYSIQETYYQTGNTGMAIHLEGTVEEVMELHKTIMEVIKKSKFRAMVQGKDVDPDIIDSDASRWAKWVRDECR